MCIVPVDGYLLSDFLTKYAKPLFPIISIYYPGKNFVLNTFGGQTPGKEESCWNWRI